MTEPAVLIRPATGADRTGVLRLAARALGWSGDERDREFFAWKHDENPFGPSPSWVAEDEGRLVGFRTFLRWELRRRGRTLRVVRAVDTATDPAAQGKGVFRSLTLHSVDALVRDGFDAVFNTPNEKSRPGYLKMGWRELGRPDLAVVPRSPTALVRMARSRAGAEKWSEPVDVGAPAAEVLANLAPSAFEAVEPEPARWSTPKTLGYLRWRYGFAPLNYRAVEVRGGWCIFRIRRRGPSTEVAICEWLSPEADRRALHRLVRTAGDYAVGVGLTPRRHGVITLRHRGPRVVWRPLADEATPSLADVGLGLGDLELF